MPDDIYDPFFWKRWGDVVFGDGPPAEWVGSTFSQYPRNPLYGIPWHAPDPPRPDDNWAQPRQVYDQYFRCDRPGDPVFLGYDWDRRFRRPLTLDEMKHNARLAGLLICDCVWLDDQRAIWVPTCEVHGRCHACGQPRYHGDP